MKKYLILSLIIGLFLFTRLFVVTKTGHLGDFVTIQYWIAQNENSHKTYYQNTGANYLPLFNYWMAGMHKVYNQGIKFGMDSDRAYWLAIRLPLIIAEAILGFIIYFIALSLTKKYAIWAVILYLFSPAVYGVGTLWGQFDTLLNLGLAISILGIIYKKYYIAFLVLTLGVLIKPSGILFFPILFSYAIVDIGWKKMIGPIVFSIAVLETTFLGFYQGSLLWPFNFIYQVLFKDQLIKKTSVGAINIWNLISLNSSDLIKFGPLTYHVWGLILFSVVIFTIIYQIYTKKNQINWNRQWLLSSTLLYFLAFYLLPTQIHERYQFFALLPLSFILYLLPKYLNIIFYLLWTFFLTLPVLQTYHWVFGWSVDFNLSTKLIGVLELILYILTFNYMLRFNRKEDSAK